jgi:cellulose biosynthesis protein BcsQ
MKIVSLFNNKGGVGKTTLAFHLSCILSEMGKKVLMIDLDPQCNLTICGIKEENLESIWKEEDAFIDDYGKAVLDKPEQEILSLNSTPRSIHYLLKPTEDGLDDMKDEKLPPVIKLNDNLGLIPGRLTINRYENVISERWSQAYQGVPLSIRTITRIRAIAEAYAQRDGYDFVLIDTSPSLGALNKVIISTVDGFIIPCLPDMFSLYGIRNIGNSLKQWQKEFNTIFNLISEEKRKRFPRNFVRFLGYTIYNAKKYSKQSNPWDLAQAHYNYAQQIPEIIERYIVKEVRQHLTEEMAHNPIGGCSVMHSHNTLPAMSQKYNKPIWEVPNCDLDAEDKSTIKGNAALLYYPTKDKYMAFAEKFIERIATLDE